MLLYFVKKQVKVVVQLNLNISNSTKGYDFTFSCKDAFNKQTQYKRYRKCY